VLGVVVVTLAARCRVRGSSSSSSSSSKDRHGPGLHGREVRQQEEEEEAPVLLPVLLVACGSQVGVLVPCCAHPTRHVSFT
jgi:hypothetical protein